MYRSIRVLGAMGALFGLLAACQSAQDDEPQGASALASPASNVNVVTSRNDNARTSLNPKEAILNTSNVNASGFGKLFTRAVDGQIYAQPLYVSGLNGRNVVFVATEHNSVLAFDADDPAASSPIWGVNLGPSVPAQDTGCPLLSPEIGITSTPYIDLGTQTIYVSAKTKENGRYVHRLHALELGTGREKAGSPVEVTATAPGTSADAVGGVLTMDPLKHMNRPAVTKVGNTIYLGFASNCDIQPYHGWVLAYDATTLRQTAVHVDTPDGVMGGIWHAGVGLSADDASGDVYYVSGNGTFDRGQRNFGNSIVRLHENADRSLKVASWFTPSDSDQLNSQDLDIGSTGSILLENDYVVTGGKAGVLYLTKRDSLGGFVQGDTGVVQRFRATQRGMFGGMAYRKPYLYVWGTGDGLRAYKFDGSKFETNAVVNTSAGSPYPGGLLALSSNGDAPNTGILWTVRPMRGGAGLSVSPGAGILQAFDAADVTRELWNSNADAADALGNISKFAPPTVANGKVYVGTASNQLAVYGLRSGPVRPQVDAGQADTSTTDTGPAVTAATFTQVYSDVFGPGTPGHCGNSGCHSTKLQGFKCGASKDECYQGLVAAGLIDPSNPTNSRIAKEGESPLLWFGGAMPLDNPADNPQAAALIKGWVGAGAKND